MSILQDLREAGAIGIPLVAMTYYNIVFRAGQDGIVRIQATSFNAGSGAFTLTVREAWVAAYTILAETMKTAAAGAAKG